jgi:hypothetical protein
MDYNDFITEPQVSNETPLGMYTMAATILIQWICIIVLAKKFTDLQDDHAKNILEFNDLLEKNDEDVGDNNAENERYEKLVKAYEIIQKKNAEDVDDYNSLLEDYNAENERYEKLVKAYEIIQKKNAEDYKFLLGQHNSLEEKSKKRISRLESRLQRIRRKP